MSRLIRAVLRNEMIRIVVRDFRATDWTQIYPFFNAIVSAGETYAYPESLSEEEARRYWVAAAPGRTVVAVDDAIVLGTAAMGPNRPGRGSHIATASFMVDPGHQGRGIGRTLGKHVLEWARAAGYRAVQFNAVVETNAVAVHLWHSLGFETLATVPEAFDHAKHGLVGLHVMFKTL